MDEALAREKHGVRFAHLRARRWGSPDAPLVIAVPGLAGKSAFRRQPARPRPVVVPAVGRASRGAGNRRYGTTLQSVSSSRPRAGTAVRAP
jgi:hypothetical protein